MFWLSGIISDDKLIIFFKVIFSLSDGRPTVWFWAIHCLFLLMPTPFPAQTVVRKPHTWEFAQCLSSPQRLSFLMKLFYFHLRWQCTYAFITAAPPLGVWGSRAVSPVQFDNGTNWVRFTWTSQGTGQHHLGHTFTPIIALAPLESWDGKITENKKGISFHLLITLFKNSLCVFDLIDPGLLVQNPTACMYIIYRTPSMH